MPTVNSVKDLPKNTPVYGHLYNAFSQVDKKSYDGLSIFGEKKIIFKDPKQKPKIVIDWVNLKDSKYSFKVERQQKK